MILKVAFVQPVYDHYKQKLQFQSKDGLNKKKSSLFESILESIIKSKYADIN